MTPDSGTQPPRPRAYTVAQVAALWGVSDTFVYELCHSGQLPGAFKLGRKLWRIPPLALDAHELRAQAGQGEDASGAAAASPAPAADPAKIARLLRHPHRS